MRPSKNLYLMTGAALLISAAFVAEGHSQPLPSPSPSPSSTISPSPSPSVSPSPSPSVSPSVTPSASPSATTLPGTAATFDDVEALNFLHHVNNLEMQEAASAQGMATSQQAQNLIQAMLTDHQQNEQQVQSLAGQKGIQLFPFQASTYELAEQQYMTTLSGTDFDNTFLLEQRQDHQSVLQGLQALEGEVTDPDIKNLITQTIPIIQKHIQLASGAAGTGAGPSASPSTSPTPS